MDKRDYSRSFTTSVSAQEAYERIADVDRWWASNFRGSAGSLNDTFDVTFGETTVAFKVIEAAPPGRLVWLVTDCHLHWLKDKKEWKDTRVAWDVSEEKDGTHVRMTHLGLVPGIECYNDCETGWNEHFGKSLPRLLETGLGTPQAGSRRR